ncbi:MAG: hypothetical protein LBK29_00200 [Oscillospiraceae bacterium]|jgi:DNA-directed RNA polymerase specialized sigma subunit|nr:hypothetical protein [Oscillospiraceae bacterium]
MINYLETKCEINLIKTRLEILRIQKEELKSLIDPSSLLFDKIKVQSSPEFDKKIIEYVYRASKIDEKISKKKNQLKFLEIKLAKMEKILREVKGLRYKIFVMRCIDGLSVRKIAWKLNFSESNVYKILAQIGLDA